MQSKIYNLFKIKAKKQSVPFVLMADSQEPLNPLKCRKYIDLRVKSGEYILDIPKEKYETLVKNIEQSLEGFINDYYETDKQKKISVIEFVKQSVATQLLEDISRMRFAKTYQPDGETLIPPDEVDMSFKEQRERLEISAYVHNRLKENLALQSHFTICNTASALEKFLERFSGSTKDWYADSLISSMDLREFHFFYDNALTGALETRVELLMLRGKQLNERNLLKMMSLKDEDDCFEFLRELVRLTADVTYDAICNDMFFFSIFQVCEKDTQKQLSRQQKTITNLRTEIEKYKAQINDLKKQKTEDENSILKRIDTAVEKAVKKQAKSTQDEMYAVKKKLSQKEKEYEELSEKYKSIITQQEYEKEIAEKVEELELTDEEIKAIKERKIVFVRDKEKDSYKVFQKLKKEYPNSKVIDSNASTIDNNATDMVVVMTQYVCHGSYWGAKGTAKNGETPVIHCQAINLDRIFDVIAYRLAYNRSKE